MLFTVRKFCDLPGKQSPSHEQSSPLHHWSCRKLGRRGDDDSNHHSRWCSKPKTSIYHIARWDCNFPGSSDPCRRRTYLLRSVSAFSWKRLLYLLSGPQQ